jgi:membrane protease YdiL (CAAX protease family)
MRLPLDADAFLRAESKTEESPPWPCPGAWQSFTDTDRLTRWNTSFRQEFSSASMPTPSAAPSTRRRYIAAYPVVIFTTWIVAWIVNLTLRSRFQWDTQADTIYWIILKAIVWVLPAVLAIQLFERMPPAAFLELRNPARGLLWGLGAGAALVAATWLGQTLPSGTALRQPHLDAAFVNAVLVAPLVEEIALRGFLLKALELDGRTFWRANALTTVVFIAMHFPGWYFLGHVATFAELARRMAPLAVLSLLFGWTRKRSGSLYAAIVLHAINNFYSALVRG